MQENRFASIRRLEESVINRIAAGEIVQRPSAAIKELVENSIDAGATSISVSAKSGGIQLLQIQDNGHGIRKEDLTIVCERFTTSKLSSFEDLRSISTFGFRGEALASITHVAHVTIQTKTRDSPCAYKAKYQDGKLVPLRAGDRTTEPRPCAGMTGTTITVEDLFYNMHTRKQAFRNTSEEYQRILDVLVRYSICFGDAGVSFMCKKHGQPLPDLHTAVGSSSLDNIRTSYGAALARELIGFKFSYLNPTSDVPLSSIDSVQQQQQQQSLLQPQREKEEDQSAAAAAAVDAPLSSEVIVEGKISNANYSTKKAIYIFFINNRLVDCASIRKAIDTVYCEILPRHMHPFVYLNIHMPPHHLDVNVHPTKKEVHFLHEDLLLHHLHQHLWDTLRSANESRTFKVQTTLLASTAATKVDDVSGVESAAVTAFNECTESSNASYPAKQGSIAVSNAHLSSDTSAATASSIKPFAPSYRAPATVGPKPFRFGDYQAGAGFSGRVALSSKAIASNVVKAAVAPSKLVRTDPTLVPINTVFKAVASSAVQNTKATADSSEEVGEEECICESPQLAVTDITEHSTIAAALDASDSENQAAVVPYRNIETSGAHIAKKRKLSNRIPGAFAFGCLCCGKQNPSPGTTAAATATTMTEAVSSESSGVSQRLKEITVTSCRYDSVMELLQQFDQQASSNITQVLKRHTFVGSVNKNFSLLQHGTKLLLVNHSKLLKECFYQLVIKQFAEMNVINLAVPIDLLEYLQVAVLAEDRCGRLPVPPEAVTAAAANAVDIANDWDAWRSTLVEKARDRLLENADMLLEYFKISIDSATGQLRSLPQLIVTHMPLSEELPAFLLRLSTEVNWDDESACFRSISNEIARYYSLLPTATTVLPPPEILTLPAPHAKLSEAGEQLLRGLLYPAMRLYLTPPRRMELDQTVVQIAALEQLYKVFERC